MSTAAPEIARESLKQLHQIVSSTTPEKRPERSLHPRHEPKEQLEEVSLPPQRNLQLKAKRPTFFLSRGEQGGQLLKRAAWLKQLNARVMGRVGLPYSAHLRLSSITRDGTAVIHADSPAWVQKGRFLQKNLLDLFQLEGVTEVKQIKLKVRFSNATQPLSPLHAKQPSTQVVQQLGDEANRQEGALRRSLRRLSNTLQRRR